MSTMAFGKRTSLTSTKQAESAPTRRRPLAGLPTVFLRRLVLIIGVVAAMNAVGYLALKLQSQWRDSVWDNMKSPSGGLASPDGE
jgi:hypothetical protein